MPLSPLAPRFAGLLLLTVSWLVAPAFAEAPLRIRSEEAGAVPASPPSNPPAAVSPWGPSSQPLFDNGPLVNNPGGGAGGADESMVQESTLGMSTLGFGNMRVFGQRAADDFVVPSRSYWDLETITFFQYQTGSTLDSTITAINLRVWDGFPDAPGSRVLFGDTVTNRLIAGQWSGIYRVREPISGFATDRPIMALDTAVSLRLYPGTYWLDWQTEGTLVSGPWVPPVTINGREETGNGQIFVEENNAWEPATDGGSGAGQGLPFLLSGTQGSMLEVPTLSGWALAGFAVLLAALAWRRLLP